MIIKLLGAIAVIVVILMSIFVILKVNSEENNNNSISDLDKFVGKWRLTNTEADISEDELPGTSEETDNFVDYETYEFFSNGTYYHSVNVDNTTGVWEINNSKLILTDDELFGALTNYYNFVFSNDNQKVTLNLIDNPENYMVYEKVIIS